MRWTRRDLWGVCLGCLLLLVGAVQEISAQGTSGYVAPQATLADKLASLASRAAVVFAGQVISIQRHGGVVEVGFRVEQSVYGTAGESFTFREWAGLWPQGQFRYTVGQRALVFVRGASAAGFASPVDGAEGVIPVVVQGAGAPELLDIRRLGAAVLRAPGTPLPTEADGAIQLSDAVTVINAALQTVTATKFFRFQPPVRYPLPTRGAPVTSSGPAAGVPEPVLAGRTVRVPLSIGTAGAAEVLYGGR